MGNQDLDSLLRISGATRLRLTITSRSTRPVGRFRDWDVRVRIGRSKFAHDRPYYRQLLFGGGPGEPLRGPNVADYYREVSWNQFTYKDAGSYGPVTWEGWDASSKTQKCVAVARLLETQGFDFRPFDTNHDGVVDLSELTVLVIHNDGTAGYGWMPSDPDGTMLEGSRLRAAPGIAFVPHRVDFETLTHELAHALSNRVVDLYGANEGLSSGLTLMGNTLNNPPDDRTSLYLDAWHRARLGWISRAFSPGDHEETGSIELGSDRLAESRGEASYLFLIRRSGGDGSESYLFEYRDGSGYDNGVGDRGIVAWHVREDGKGNPSAGAGDDIPGHAIYAVGPDAARGARRAWKPSDGRFRLRWSDGSLLPQKFWVEASSAERGSALLEWRTAGGTNDPSP
jgi:M6 family metalloprotease-like protein